MNESLRRNISLKMKVKEYSPEMINIYLDFVSSTKIDNNSKSSKWIMAFGGYVKEVTLRKVFDDKGFDIVRNTKKFQNIVERHLSTKKLKEGK